MNELEKRGIMPKLWARYVDDILVIVPSEDIKKTLERINDIYCNITFTMEKEDEQRIAFLDLSIIRNKNKLEFDIFRKKTHTKRTVTMDNEDVIKRVQKTHLLDATESICIIKEGRQVTVLLSVSLHRAVSS